MMISTALCLLSFCKAAYAVAGMAECKGGWFEMGVRDRRGKNGESPPWETAVKPFYIDLYPVTNRDFRAFMASRPNYKTDAEERGWSLVFEGHLVHPDHVFDAAHHAPANETPWMIPLISASWKRPRGPGSTIDDVLDHPVVHVSKRDAAAYCYSVKKRLPTEIEWEYAARGGLDGAEYPWGETYEKKRANLWQGSFPDKDDGGDGYKGTSPVQAFRPQNAYGLHDMIGNVWEWTLTIWHLMHKRLDGKDAKFTLKGGSHMDSRKGETSDKIKPRTSARMGRLMYYTAGNVGFRCAVSKNPQVRPIKWNRNYLGARIFKDEL